MPTSIITFLNNIFYKLVKAIVSKVKCTLTFFKRKINFVSFRPLNIINEIQNECFAEVFLKEAHKILFCNLTFIMSLMVIFVEKFSSANIFFPIKLKKSILELSFLFILQWRPLFFHRKYKLYNFNLVPKEAHKTWHLTTEAIQLPIKIWSRTCYLKRFAF